MYYRHSGKVAPLPFALALAACFAFAFFLALLYAFVELEMRRQDLVKAVVAAATAFALARSVAWAMFGARVRNVQAARFVGMTVGAFFVYVAWAAWLPQFCSEPITTWELLLRPRAIVQGMQLVSLHGAWALADQTPTDLALDPAWTVEALLFLALPGLLAARHLHGVFCERCDAWCVHDEGGLRVSRGAGEDSVRAILDAKNWSALFGPPIDVMDYMRIELDRCPACGETNVLGAACVTTRVRWGRMVRRVALPHDRRLVLTKTEVHALEQEFRDAEAARRAEGRADMAEVGQRLRDRAAERERVAREVKSELVPNEDGVVHGPTRAELVVAAINTLAFAPFLGCPTVMVAVVLESVFGRGLFRGVQGEKIALSIYGTLVVASFLLPLWFLVKPRPVSRVRAHVFESGKNGPWLALALIGFYVFVILAWVAIKLTKWL